MREFIVIQGKIDVYSDELLGISKVELIESEGLCELIKHPIFKQFENKYLWDEGSAGEKEIEFKTEDEALSALKGQCSEVHYHVLEIVMVGGKKKVQLITKNDVVY